MKTKPCRMCTVCREMKDKSILLRIVLNKDGEMSVDAGGKMHGRGAYICHGCMAKAAKTKALERSFKRNIPKEIYEQIEEWQNGCIK